MYFCDLDDNYTEHFKCENCDELVCSLCHNAYGCPSIQMSVATATIELLKKNRKNKCQKITGTGAT